MNNIVKRVCPKCKKIYSGHPAISRVGLGEICSKCGVLEALTDWANNIENSKEV